MVTCTHKLMTTADDGYLKSLHLLTQMFMWKVKYFYFSPSHYKLEQYLRIVPKIIELTIYTNEMVP